VLVQTADTATILHPDTARICGGLIKRKVVQVASAPNDNVDAEVTDSEAYETNSGGVIEYGDYNDSFNDETETECSEETETTDHSVEELGLETESDSRSEEENKTTFVQDELSRMPTTYLSNSNAQPQKISKLEELQKEDALSYDIYDEQYKTQKDLANKISKMLDTTKVKRDLQRHLSGRVAVHDLAECVKTCIKLMKEKINSNFIGSPIVQIDLEGGFDNRHYEHLRHYLNNRTPLSVNDQKDFTRLSQIKNKFSSLYKHNKSTFDQNVAACVFVSQLFADNYTTHYKRAYELEQKGEEALKIAQRIFEKKKQPRLRGGAGGTRKKPRSR
jgi:hypothetical protein